MALHVLYSFPLRLGVSGIGTTAWQQVQGLADLGIRVTLFCGSLERPLRGVERVVETMKVGPIPIPYRAIGLDRSMAWHDWHVARALSHDPSVNVVHCWPSGALRTLRRAEELNIAHVLERPSSHTSHVYEAARKESEKLGVRLLKNQYANSTQGRRLAKEEEEFRLAQYLLCPSDAAAQTFRDRGFDERQLRLHQYGYDPAIFSHGERTLAEDPSAPLRAVFVGLCFPLKGLHIALEAWRNSSASATGTFSICGEFVPGYREAIAKSLDHPSIRVLGFRRDVADVMRQADVLVHPSLSEGSALVTYEAQACGLIPMVSDAAGARCTNMVDGLVHPAGDINALQAHFDLLMSDQQLRSRLRNAVWNRSSELTWAAAARRLAEIYDEARQSLTHGERRQPSKETNQQKS